MIYESSTSYFSFLVFFLSLPVITYLGSYFAEVRWTNHDLLRYYWVSIGHVQGKLTPNIYFWPKNDDEKWSRKKYFEIPLSAKLFLIASYA